MHVNFLSANINTKQPNNAVSFKGVRICPVPLQEVLPDGKLKAVRGYLTKLDETDEELIKSIAPKWLKSTYGGSIVHTFKRLMKVFKEVEPRKQKEFLEKGDMFFMVECPKFKKPEQRVCALAMVSPCKADNSLMLTYLQSGRSFLPEAKTRVAGSGLLYGLSKFAEQKNYDTIGLIAGSIRAERMYLKNGFYYGYDIVPGYLYLPKSDYSKLRETIKARADKTSKK